MNRYTGAMVDASALISGLSVLNMPMLADLRAALGAEAVAAMMPTFMRNMAEYRDELSAAILAQDLTKARRAAHSLKGLAAQFGAPQVSALARAIEQDAQSIADAVRLLDALLVALDAAVQAIAAELPSPAVAAAAKEFPLGR